MNQYSEKERGREGEVVDRESFNNVKKKYRYSICAMYTITKPTSKLDVDVDNVGPFLGDWKGDLCTFNKNILIK